jgi:hypothetical protein
MPQDSMKEGSIMKKTANNNKMNNNDMIKQTSAKAVYGAVIHRQAGITLTALSLH